MFKILSLLVAKYTTWKNFESPVGVGKLFIYGVKQEAEGCANISNRWDVNSRHDDSCKLSQELKGSIGDCQDL